MSYSRVFEPELRGFDSSVDPSDVVWYDYDDEVSRLHRAGRRRRPGSRPPPMVLWTDGACRGNGTSWAEAGYGVFFGHGSRYNCSGVLPEKENHTSQSAEIYAALRAIKRLNKIDDEVCEDGIVVVTDSDYLFRAITDYIYKWVDNGFLNAKGRPVANGKAFNKLHDAVEDWEDSGVTIRFWRVSREQNTDADSLANCALDY